jgi:hypothetical protein
MKQDLLMYPSNASRRLRADHRCSANDKSDIAHRATGRSNQEGTVYIWGAGDGRDVFHMTADEYLQDGFDHSDVCPVSSVVPDQPGQDV